jgi:hypothetical protein
MTTPALSRREFLRATGLTLTLPLLEALIPRAIAAGATPAPRRMVCICRGLGLYGPDFFPAQAGRNYALSPYLEPLATFRDDFTVISGLSHANAGSGHACEISFLSGAPHAGAPSFKNTVSLDQLAAEHVGNATRYPFLALATHHASMSVTRNGVQVPPDKDPAAIFRKLFIRGTPAEVTEQEHQLQLGRSVLDSVRTELKSLSGNLGTADRDRLDQYTTAVRDVEKRLHNSEAWMKRPKPVVTAEVPGPYPSSEDIVGRTRMMLDLIHLALETDSTRVVTMLMDQAGGNGVPPIEGVSEGRHGLSHHGLDPTKIAQLRRIELAELKAFGEFIGKLKNSAGSAGSSLLDQTMVVYGSNMGNASSHDTRNLPILLAGGGFRHGQHLAFDQSRNAPLSNLYTSMLQRFGLEAEKFSTGTGTLTGLQFA